MSDPSFSLPSRVVTSFGGLAEMARAMGHRSCSTIHGWVANSRIPRWRLPEIRAAARRAGIDLPEDFPQEDEAA